MKSLIILFSIIFIASNISYAQNTQGQTSITTKPSIYWGGYPRGRVETSVFKKQKQIRLPEGYTLKKAIVNFAGAGFKTVERYNLYSLNLDNIQDAIDRCIPGTVIYIEKILTVDKNGQNVFLSNAGFALY